MPLTASMARDCGVSWSMTVAIQCIMFLVISGQFVRTDSDLPLKHDFRIISFSDILSDDTVYEYENQHIEDYSQMVIDSNRNQLIVGARDHLLRLSLENLNELESVTWEPKNSTIMTCRARGQEKENCHNFVRVLILHDDKVFTCGTNAFNPNCTWRDVDQISNVQLSLTGIAKCPYNPHHNTTALMTSNGDLYSATVTDYTGRDPAIWRMMGPSRYLRTVQSNSRWLNEPNFVSSYEINEFVYFFFRETAVEYINCGKSIYSRVARICKTDAGGKFVLEDNWTTFTKARLNCSLPGDYPFYFSELQGTYFVEDQELVYAVFSTAPTSVYASAVCVYNTTSLNNAFSGPFKYRANAEMAWTRVPNSLPNLQCAAEDSENSLHSSSRKNQTPAQRHLLDAQKFQMMDEAVQPMSQIPVVVAENERFTHIAVHQIATKHHENFNVLFLVTLEGYVKKFITLPYSQKTCLVEEIRVVSDHEVHPVQSFQLDEKRGALFLGMRDKIFRIPVQRCNRFSSKVACLNSQDPYCGWNSQKHRCTPIPSSFPDPDWHQDINSCPILETPVDGGWSEWSEWEKCDHEVSGGHCKCSRRLCNDPKPRHGGRHCSGIDVRVTNCTTHGGWTEWSEWSACSATCGRSSRSRRRSCSNPTPAHGGRVCVGPQLDTFVCVEAPCPSTEVTPAPQHGGWSEWSIWSTCDKHCDGGIRTRQRACINPPPMFGGNECTGNNEEWERCNTHECPNVRKSSWTEWTKTNVTSKGYTQERYRFICKAPVSEEDKIQIVYKHHKQDCTGADCGDYTGLEEISQWSKWSSWTNCDNICGGGQQHRERACEGFNCEGHGREVRFCNEHSCDGEWSCWGEFSQCSVTCGVGSKWRRRNCVSAKPGGHYSRPCRGRDYEEVQCTMPPCENAVAFDGWGEWSDWTMCDENNQQRRERQCLDPFTNQQCQGLSVQSRICQFNTIDSVPREMKVSSSDMAQCVAIFVPIIVGIVCFILGGVICVGICLYCQRQRQENQSQQNFMPRCDVRQNVYMRPEDARSDFSELNNKYNSLQKNKDINMSMTVNEATLKRNQILRTNSMRTNLTLVDNEYT